MTRRDFLYWLQGYFEMADLDEPILRLSQKQFECVANHAHLVYAHEGLKYGMPMTHPGECTDVFRWISYFSPSDGLTERATHELRRLVGRAFQHCIDPTAGGPATQKELNAIHGNDEETMRC